MKKRFLCSLAAATLLLTGCAAQSAKPPTATQTATAAVHTTADPSARTTGTGFYFDTVVTFTLYGADETLMTELQNACVRYEQLLSRTIPESDVGRINAAEGQTVTVDAETADILRRARC